jgi:hypothetical protein
MITPVTKLVMLATAWSARERNPWLSAASEEKVKPNGSFRREAGLVSSSIA